MVVFLWCGCGGVLVVGVFVAVFLWWCSCGGVLVVVYKVLLQYYKVLLRTTKYYSSTTRYTPTLQSTTPVLLQYYSVLQSTTPVLLCTTQHYKVLLQYYSVLQNTTPLLLCTTKYYSNTTLYYKVLLQYENFEYKREKEKNMQNFPHPKCKIFKTLVAKFSAFPHPSTPSNESRMVKNKPRPAPLSFWREKASGLRCFLI